MAALDRLLAAATGARRRIVVSDTLFSMDGSRAPLADLCGLARRHAAILVVDEAHATGLFGAGGSGLVEEAGCADGVHVRIGTLSKAIGAAGGFVAGHPDLVHWLRHAARAWIFSTAHPPAVAAAAARGLALVTAEPDRRRELAARAADFRGLLAATGLDTGTAEAQIVPVIVGLLAPHSGGSHPAGRGTCPARGSLSVVCVASARRSGTWRACRGAGEPQGRLAGEPGFLPGVPSRRLDRPTGPPGSRPRGTERDPVL